MTKKTGNEVYNIVAFVFADRQEAKRVSDELKRSAKGEGYKVIANAVVEVDEKGKAHVHEAGHGAWGTALGAGGVGLLSLIGGPAGLLAWAVAGGVIGGFAGRFAGRAIPAKDMKQLAERMQPNTSAILAMVEDTWAETLINDMAPYKAHVVTLTVGDELSGEIAQAVAVQSEAPAGGQAAAESEAPAEDPGKTLSNMEVWQV